MSDELRKLREAVYDLATDGTEVLDDEAWYDRLWELLEPVTDARSELVLRGLTKDVDAAVNTVNDPVRDAERCPVTWNPGVWPYTTRCMLNVNHTGDKHLDRHGHTFIEPVAYITGNY